MGRRRSAAAWCAGAALVIGALAGCTASGTSPPPTQPPPDANVDFASAAQGATPVAVLVTLGAKVVITPPSGAHLAAECWQATIADPAVLTFPPANSSGPTGGIPMLAATQGGRTTAVLTYSCSSTPQRITLDVTVTGYS
ncbi:hypothetical protein [Cellulomonas sp. 73-92]|uniref:hypothetical protein n=1 Tax=Cellulomonas sp. 73-92 TaxID=1895740 RepID=UPI000A866498|nr:hypothetical protein [Cellulomonas sp. 73-92]